MYFCDNGTEVGCGWLNAILDLNQPQYPSLLTLNPSHLPQEWGAERREQTGPHMLKMKRFQGCISHLSLIFGFPLNCIVVNGCSG